MTRLLITPSHHALPGTLASTGTATQDGATTADPGAPMATWSTLVAEAPDLARAARGFLDAHRHKAIATLRRAGSPRISGIESFFVGDDLWFGAMWRSRKALDLRRDPRFALHSGSDDPPDWRGDVSLSGRAEEVVDPAVMAEIAHQLDTEPPSPWHLFRADLSEVVVVTMGDPADHLLIDVWTPGAAVRRLRR